MPGIEASSRSSVIVIECPAGFVLERRPNIDGVIHPGQLGLFGGHLHAGEDAYTGLTREILEETDLDPSVMGIEPVWLDQPGRHGPDGRVGEIIINTFYGTTPRRTIGVKGTGSYEVLPAERFIGEKPADMTLFAFFAIKNLPPNIRRTM